MSGSRESLTCEDAPIVNPTILTETKKCGVCGMIKSVNEFNKKIDRGKYILRHFCKLCHKADTQRWQKANPDKVRAESQRQRDKYPEKSRESVKKYRMKHPEVIREAARRWRNKNRNNANFKIRRNISGRLWASLRGIAKSKSTFKFLGYSVTTLMSHLERQFKDGMTWENYGDWHVDHKRPCCTFNFTSIDCEDVKTCWSLNNLQPLWAIENRKKWRKKYLPDPNEIPLPKDI